jgi:hypothetical protein
VGRLELSGKLVEFLHAERSLIDAGSTVEMRAGSIDPEGVVSSRPRASMGRTP